MQTQVYEALNELNTILPKVTMYDKELRLVQSSIKALQNQLKGQGDQLGE